MNYGYKLDVSRNFIWHSDYSKWHYLFFDLNLLNTNPDCLYHYQCIQECEFQFCHIFFGMIFYCLSSVSLPSTLCISALPLLYYFTILFFIHTLIIFLTTTSSMRDGDSSILSSSLWSSCRLLLACFAATHSNAGASASTAGQANIKACLISWSYSQSKNAWSRQVRRVTSALNSCMDFW